MKRNKKIKKIQKNIHLIVLVIILILAIVNPSALEKIENVFISQTNIINNEIKVSEKNSEQINIENEKLNILYLDVGQADSQIILFKDKVIIIDTGNMNDGEKIIEYLKSLNISKIDYLIGTHIHEDHIGSMQYFVKEFKIDNIYLPYNEKTTTTYYKNLLNEIMNKELEITEVQNGDKIEIEDLNFEIMAVDNNEPEDENDASIVIEVNYKENKFLFTGDATKKVEKSRNWNDIDVLKVGHHGSNTSSSDEFIKQIKPEVSIISVGENNSYNLPKDSVIETLEENNSKVYRTDIDGTIQIISDGISYEILKIDKSFDGKDE